jgi:SpoVK/Ycf46/Vps4 family AAA+-type ATPase
VDLSIIRKQLVGESEKAINELFSLYKKLYERKTITPILFINEADGLFQKRISDINGSSNSTLALDFNTIQNMLLDKLEDFEGIMIGTSNFITNMDEALDRRILYKVNFAKPNKDTQKKIWKSRLPELSSKDINELVSNFDFTGGIINNIFKKSQINYILYGEEANYMNLEKLCKMEFVGKKEIKIGFI